MNKKQIRAENIGLRYIKCLLEKKGCKVVIPKEDNYPIRYFEVYSPLGSNNSRIEIKTVSNDVKSGSIGVVISRNINGYTLPAGAFTSPAEYFVFVVAGNPGAFGIQTIKLRQLIKEERYMKVVTNDDGEYNIAVFNKQLLLDNCEHIDSVVKQ